jgi:hypothetical protein
MCLSHLSDGRGCKRLSLYTSAFLLDHVSQKKLKLTKIEFKTCVHNIIKALFGKNENMIKDFFSLSITDDRKSQETS